MAHPAAHAPFTSRSPGAEFATAIALAIALLAPSARATSLQETAWISPVGGDYNDPSRWTNGVPASSSALITFGLNAGTTPFVVDGAGSHACGSIAVSNQRPTLNLAAGSLLFVYQGVSIAPATTSDSPSLVIAGGTIIVNGSDIIVGSGLGAGSLTFDGGEALIRNVSVVQGSLLLDHGGLIALAAAPPAARLTLGVGGVASLDLRDRSIMYAWELTQIGGSGGDATWTLTDGAVFETGNEIMIGGNALSAQVGPGHASVTLSNATIRTDIERPLSIGEEGTALVTLESGAVIDGFAIAVGGSDETSSGTMQVLGAANVDGSIGVGRSGSLRVSGPDAVLHCSGNVFGASLAGGEIVADDGAALHATHIALASSAPAMTVRNGAVASCESLRLGHVSASLLVDGAASRVEAGALIRPQFAAHTGEITLRNGGQVAVGSMEGDAIESLRAEFGPDGPGRLSIATDGTFTGCVAIDLADGAGVPAVGSYRLIEGGTLAIALTDWTTIVAHGFPIYPRIGSEAVDLIVTDHVDGLVVTSPVAPMVNGYLYPVRADAVLDGIASDVTPAIAVESRDPSIVAVEGTHSVRAMAPGRTAITVTFGGASVTHEVEVTAPSFAPIVLVSQLEGAASTGDAAIDFDEVHAVGLAEASAAGVEVVFASRSSTLVAGDTNGAADVFVRNLTSGEVERISLKEDGSEAPLGSGDPAITPDGRFVAFRSRSPLLARYPTVQQGAYLRDRWLGTLTLLSIASDGTPSPSYAAPIAVSADGRFVLMASYDDSLVPGDNNGDVDAVVRDCWTGTTTLASCDALGAPFATGTTPLDMSNDGRFVVMRRELAWGDHGPLPIVVKDMVTGAVTDLTAGFDPFSAGDETPDASISGDGEVVAFLTSLGGLVDPPPPQWTVQGYVWERATGVITPFTTIADGSWPFGAPRGVTVSDRGRYIAFVTSDEQCYRFDRVAGEHALVSVGPLGVNEGHLHRSTAIAANGQSVVFSTRDDSLAAFDGNGFADVLVRRFGSGVMADLDEDGYVGQSDLAILLAAWGTTDEQADVNGDGTVNASDLAALLGGWTWTGNAGG